MSTTDKEDWMLEGTGSLLKEFTSSSIPESQNGVSSREDPELICSFNWAKTKQPTILVPGGAPEWTPPALPVKLPRDSEIRNPSQDDDPLLPKYPFEPVLRAASIMNPNFRFSSRADVLVRRNTLRKLLLFCQGGGGAGGGVGGGGKKQESYRINLFCVGITLILERCEGSDAMMLHGSPDSGYGHSFERAFTRPHPGCEDSLGHHRVLLYDVGGVRCAVGFEVDACFRAEGVDEVPSTAAETSKDTPDSPADDDDPDPSVVKVIHRGSGTPQSAVAELKITRKKLWWLLPQMWFGRNRYFIRGVCPSKPGHVKKIEAVELGREFTSWEEKPAIQKSLRKLATLLSRLRGLVRATEEKACVLVYGAEDVSTLNVYAWNPERGALPDDIVEKYW
ncbi:hypothetical protein ACRE_009280 [Hapsidospora chrysogenum ATCC 11550]|uniref:Uncharacterized protein n=1 Tax=Hapsidospora chrysogenum (strain ATCC 11550 / CBS 779.69 / DSM 880 / IAM 14645 / JCM 23072 / IMI 49137) TaxID=857340 RepID=A0A086TFT8_HAPC1|nr:hypothetical protein ACRE_009280 [Hapsidospora chrysogenum ATCC 11550]